MAQNITVKRFYLKYKMDQVNNPIRYYYALWPVNHQSFLPTQIDIQCTGEIQVNWNAVDQLISGETSYLASNLRLWNIQLVILPSDNTVSPSEGPLVLAEKPLDVSQARAEEGKRVQAFMKFSSTLFRHRLFKKEIQLDVRPVTEFASRANHGSMDSFTSEGADSLPVSIPTSDEQLVNLVERMRQPKNGLDIKDHKRTLTRRTVRRCFEGRELVNWIIRNVETANYSRESAIELSERLMKCGLLMRVTGSQKGFEDTSQLYRFAEDQNVVDIRNASLIQKKTKPMTPLKPAERSQSTTVDPPQSYIPFPSFTGGSETKHMSMQYTVSQILTSFSFIHLPQSSPKVIRQKDAEEEVVHSQDINSTLYQIYLNENKRKSVKLEVADRGKKTDRYQWIVSSLLPASSDILMCMETAI